MLIWFSANWINILFIALITAMVFLLIRGMIRDRKAGKHACGDNCASCGACSSCRACSACGTGGSIAPMKKE